MVENADEALSRPQTEEMGASEDVDLLKWSLDAVEAYVRDARCAYAARGGARDEASSQEPTLPDAPRADLTEDDAQAVEDVGGQLPSIGEQSAPSGSLNSGVEEASRPAGSFEGSSDSPAPPANYRYDGGVPASPGESERQQDWGVLQTCLDGGESVIGLVTGWNRGGLLIHWRGLQGFVPASQLREIPRAQDPESREAQMARYVGAELTLRIMELDRSRSRLVLSERAMEWGVRDGDAVLASLKPGQICGGRVSNVCDFGVFVDLGGIDGLIHVSEIAWRHVPHPREVLAFGQEIDVYVLSVDESQRRVALSLKRAQSNPWATVDDRYSAGQIVEGTVTNVVSFGAFARIEDGVEGLIHISELADDAPVHPSRVVRDGDVVKLRVLRVDSRNHRFALSLRQAGQASEPSSAVADSDEDGNTF